MLCVQVMANLLETDDVKCKIGSLKILKAGNIVFCFGGGGGEIQPKHGSCSLAKTLDQTTQYIGINFTGQFC